MLKGKDKRSTIDKLRDLVNHPNTGANERKVAQEKIKTLLANKTPKLAKPEPTPKPTIAPTPKPTYADPRDQYRAPQWRTTTPTPKPTQTPKPTLPPTPTPPPTPPPTLSNISGDTWSQFYIAKTTCKDIFDRLCSLKPKPSEIYFLRQGKIIITVPPPYHGLSKHQYFNLIKQQLPFIRHFSSKYDGIKGYIIELSCL